MIFDVLEDTDWMMQGLCKENPALFYPENGKTAVAAKKICAICPVKEPCLNYALEHRERYGVWGGTSEKERRKMRVARRAKPCKYCGTLFTPINYKTVVCSDSVCRARLKRERNALTSRNHHERQRQASMKDGLIRD